MNAVAPSRDPHLLDERAQRRNVILYAVCASLVYLCAAVTYVGIVQVGLCQSLGASDTIANLPIAAFYLAMTAPLIVAWRFHSVASIKPVLATAFLLAALACLLMALTLYLPMTSAVRLAAVTMHSALIGGTTAVTSTFQWDVINRGMNAPRRGAALSLAYGIGPVFAVVGSLAAQLVLAGEVVMPWYSSAYGVHWTTLTATAAPFPGNYAWLFAAAAPLLAFAALLTTLYVLPPDSSPDAPRKPLLAGLTHGGREFLGDPNLRRTLTAYLLVGSAGAVVSIMALYAPEATGRAPSDMAGYQSAMRFAFKMTAGLALGWLVTRTSPRLGVIATALLYLAGISWVLAAPLSMFVVCFGLMGAGDLYGVYFPNYVMAASPADQVKQNVAFLQLLGLPVCAAPTLLGVIADYFGRQTSFVVAAMLAAAAIISIILKLPRHPTAE